MSTAVTAPMLIDFVYHEAELLDTGNFDAWLDLFTTDGVYWMPLEPGQQERRLVGSLMNEDLSLIHI